MTGSARTSADLDPRRRRILFRAWHRGIREMDLILGQFADAFIADLSDDELARLEDLLEENDRDLYQWAMGEVSVPVASDTAMLRRVIEFRKSLKF